MQNYQPHDIEQKWQKFWYTHNINQPTFHQKDNFCIQLPPPNVTGVLHMGHAFNQTIMDALVRYARMSQKNTLWVPGTDHAGIATQIVVERQLEAQDIKKEQLGRAAFIDKIWAWKQQSGGLITEQMKRLGASISWEHEYFTMDDKMSRAVIDVFVRLHQDGLIYRGQRLVNWDPKLKSAVSDLEVVNHEEQGFLWHISYPLVNVNTTNHMTSLTVATTRPETLFGDVAIMVNPNDERYQHLIGQSVHLPLSNRCIPIIADEYVDITFGTGVVKVTPAHDFNDYAVAQRHKLDCINIFNLDATCNASVSPEFVGLDRFAARKKVLELLTQNGLLLKQQNHTLMVPRCERTGEIIEPMLTKQWFIDLTSEQQENGKIGGLNAITRPALEAVISQEIKIIPPQWQQTYEHWLNNIQDWCISRQLWWGHRIPAWYSEDHQHIFVAHNEADAYTQAQQKGYHGKLKQDEDVLDTWFSSALVPFSSLGWPQNTPELTHFLPSNVLVTGYDIIFFWVARMIMMTRYFTGKNPFNVVYVHGLIRDADGKKMSKSEGNTLDPVDLIDGIALDDLLEKRTAGLRRPETKPQVITKTKQNFPNGISAFGTDALRFTFASLASLGRNINFDVKRCEGYRNFCNKLWNATRFVLMNIQDKDCGQSTKMDDISKHFTFADIWILNQLKQTQHELQQHFNNYRLDLASNVLYQLVWDNYCDWYLELAKVQMQNNTDNINIARSTRYVLLYTLEQILRLIHPIMPFITEELWQELLPFLQQFPQHYSLNKITNNQNTISIATQQYPINVTLLNYIQDNQQNNSIQNYAYYMDSMQSIVYACRNLRSEMQIAPSQKIDLDILLEATNVEKNIDKDKSNLSIILPYIQSLAKIAQVSILDTFEDEVTAPVMALSHIDMSLRLNVPIDIETEMIRLNKTLDKLKQEIEKCNNKLQNAAFVDKAPALVVEQERNRLKEFENNALQVNAQLQKLI